MKRRDFRKTSLTASALTGATFWLTPGTAAAAEAGPGAPTAREFYARFKAGFTDSIPVILSQVLLA